MADSRGVRRLAVAVFQRAALDAAGMIYSDAGGDLRADTREVRRRRIRDEAYAWLTTPSWGLALWADAAGIAMKDVIDGADSAVEYARRTADGDRRRMKKGV